MYYQCNGWLTGLLDITGVMFYNWNLFPYSEVYPIFGIDWKEKENTTTGLFAFYSLQIYRFCFFIGNYCVWSQYIEEHIYVSCPFCVRLPCFSFPSLLLISGTSLTFIKKNVFRNPPFWCIERACVNIVTNYILGLLVHFSCG